MLKILRRIIEEVDAAENFQAVLDVIALRVGEAVDATNCTIFLFDHEYSQFRLKAAHGLAKSLVGKAVVPLGQGLLSIVAEKGEPLNLADAQTHSSYLPLVVEGVERLHAFLGVPIQYQRKLLGVLTVRHETAEAFDGAEEAFLVTVCSQLAKLIVQAETSEQLSESKDTTKKHDTQFVGISSVPGVAIGEAVVVFPAADLDAIPDQKADNVDTELVNFHQALADTRNEVRVLGDRMASTLPVEERALFDAYLKLLESNTLIQEIEDEIKNNLRAQSALKRVIKRHALKFRGLENEYLRERASDLEDLGRRILSHLQAESKEEIDYPEKTILVGDEVMASNLAEVPEGRLCGVVSAKGSTNSHVAILARALGVPTVMGVEALVIAQLQKQQMIVDGYVGRVYFSPSPTLLKEYKVLEQQERQLDKELEDLRELPAETEDGQRIALHVNTGLMADIGRSMTSGAEGVGLYRTEVPFMIRDRFPTSEEQRVIYKQLLSAFAPLPVTMRTLDVGGDKQLPYFPIEDENPFLGWRGIRISLDHPEIFQTQVRAMMRASEGFSNLRVMLPMISDVSELDEALSMMRKAYLDVVEEGLDVVMPKVGVMVEVPSAVYQAQLLAQRVEFLSVGSNDLTQYILAVDRNNARVASLYNSLHPAVLAALQKVVDDAHREGKSASVCGEMAGDPLAAVLLLAMGYDSLSMSATALPRIKWVIRKLTKSRARKILGDVMAMDDCREIRRYLEQALEELGLGGLVRAGL